MNKILIAAMLFPTFVAFASENLDAANLAKVAKVAKERDEWTKKYFAKQGSPVPDGGVTVLPEQQHNIQKTTH